MTSTRERDIMTADGVETRLGTLQFELGTPNA